MNFMSTMAMGLVAGVLVDDAIVEIENIVRHMRMGKSAYQASLDAADEIGLAVLATTMAIVAVFFPVALMPGIAGQYFKAFGFTVVAVGADELVRRANDHAADRRLFPALAGRPAARGVEVDGPLPEGPQLEPRYDRRPTRCWPGCPSPAASSAIMPRRFLLLLPVFAAFLAGTAAARWAARQARPARARSAFALAVVVGARARLCRRQARSPSSCGMIGRRICRMARDRGRALECAHAGSPPGDGRRRHRHVAAQRRPVRHAAAILLPAAERRLFARSTSSCRPAARSSRPRRRPTALAAIVSKDPNVERVFERVQRRHRTGEHRPQEGPQGHEHRVRARALAVAGRVPRRARQLPEPERRRARRGRTRHHALSSAATIRCS